ncbi:MAG: C40 family peptidase [Cyclobacteriaceae bacterium]|nr:C40 family peptidase [Cyclobacteriaceae bacterium]
MAGELVEQIRMDYAPDKRTAVFDIQIRDSTPLGITGTTNLPQARAALLAGLRKRDIKVKEEIELLPHTALGENIFGLINLSVANMRSRSAYNAELVTQALLGTPVNILLKKDDWYLVQTPDRYIAWITTASLVPMSAQKIKDWKKASKIIYINTYGHALGPDLKNRVSDLVAGDVLQLHGESAAYWMVTFPDGREARIARKEAKKLPDWIANITVSDSSMVRMATSLMGVPYLWGGTSVKGVDCSGFTKTVFLMHGYVLPRDASQQVFAGQLVDSVGNFSQHRVGDLLFFGRKNEDGSERVIHVGLWIGDQQFIHAAGDVHISSIDSLQPHYDRYNHQRYLRTRRLIGIDDPLIAKLAEIY